MKTIFFLSLLSRSYFLKLWWHHVIELLKYYLVHASSVIQSCPILCDSTDSSPPDCSVHYPVLSSKNTGVVDISSSRGSSGPTDQTHVSCGFCIGRQILFHWARLGSPNIILNGGQTQRHTKLSWTFISQNCSFPISVLHSIRWLNHGCHLPSISHFNNFRTICDTEATALKTHKPKLR